jgi:PAS domain S-box-containing protein
MQRRDFAVGGPRDDRLDSLRSVAEATARAETAERACELAAAALGASAQSPWRVGFYLLESASDGQGRRRIRLVASGTPSQEAPGQWLAELDGSWLDPGPGEVVPGVLALAGSATLLDAVREAADVRRPIASTLPGDALPVSRGTAGPEQLAANGRCHVLPMIAPVDGDLLGFLVAGEGPRSRAPDADETFLSLVAGFVAAAIAGVRARDRRDDPARRRTRAAPRAGAETVSAGSALGDEEIPSEERFARFMEQLPGLAWIKDLHGRYVYVNDAAQVAFRAGRAAILGHTDEEIFPPEIASVFRENDRRALESEAGVQTVETLEHADGVLHHSLISKFPMHGPDGRARWVGGMAIDITDRMRAEAALREGEERFRILADSSPVLIWVTGLEGCEFVNLTYREFVGASAEEVHGDGWMRFVHPDDLGHYIGAFERALARRGTFDAEMRFRRHDGAYRWMRSVGSPRFGPSDELLGYCGSTIDVSEQRQVEQELRESEQRYRAIVESQAEMVCRFRADGKILFANDAYARARGATGEGFAGTSLWSFVHGEDRRRVEELLAQLSPEAPEIRIENRVHTADGERWTLWTNRALAFDEHGRWTEAQSAGIDITQRKEMEEALREADQRKDHFLATLAHELRSPLAPLRNGLELIRLAAGDPDATERSRALMERQLAQMVRLIDDLLDLSRISRGRIQLHTDLVPLSEVVRQAEETVAPMIAEHGHELVVQLPSQPVWLEGDPVRLAQVLSNLLHNAAKFTEPGGRIVLAAERKDERVEVVVRDDGVGIPADLLPRIFDVFSESDRSLLQPKSGLGIGLSLVRTLVEMHGGFVEAWSEGIGRGSEFVVRLPVAGAPVAAVAVPEEMRQPAAAARPRRILVVDDNRDSATSLAELLGLFGHQTETAHDGLEALAAAARFRPEVILLDLGMPKLDGYETARRIRSEPWGREVLLVAVTGWGQDSDRERSQQAGFDLHLVKPVDLAKLESLLAGQ